MYTLCTRLCANLNYSPLLVIICLFFTSQNLIFSQGILVDDIKMEEGLFDVTPRFTGERIEDFDYHTYLHSYNKYEDKTLLFASTNLTTVPGEMGPPSASKTSLIIIDNEGKVLKKSLINFEGCEISIKSIKVVNNKDLLLIAFNKQNELLLYYLTDFESSFGNICDYQVFQLALDLRFFRYTAEIDVEDLGRYITLSTQAKDTLDQAIVYQAIIDTKEMKVGRQFYITNPEDHRFSSFCYLSGDQLAFSFITNDDRTNIPHSSIYLADRERNFTDNIDLGPRSSISSLTKADSDHLIVSGALVNSYTVSYTGYSYYDQQAHIWKINSDGTIVWEHGTLDDPHSYYINSVVVPEGDIYVHGYHNKDENDDLDNREPVIIRKYNASGVYKSGIILGEHHSGYSSKAFLINKDNKPTLIANYGHTGSNIGYIYTFNTEPISASILESEPAFIPLINPNPFSDYFNIDLKGPSEPLRYETMDLSGRIIDSGWTHGKINASNYLSGPYFIKIYDSDKSYTVKILKR